MNTLLGAHPQWIVPQWPAPPTVKAIITTRAGGVSLPPYESLNLGFSTDDDRRAVAENRKRLRALLPQEPRWLKQVHGARVVPADALIETPEADAAIALNRGTVCAILIADCLPILLADGAGTLIAAAHAGWRGLAAGVLDNTVEAMRSAGARDIIAYIGPGIGPRAFEVSRDVHDAFVARDNAAGTAFVPHGPGKWLADLPQLAARALRRCGVNDVHAGNLCTYSDPERFYSYRRDRVTGRMAALIWRE